MTVMVVDDTDSARDVAQRILRHYGVHSIGARSGSEAFALLEEFDPDLILLDLAMPDMDGLSVLAQLRKDPRWTGIPVVMLSAVCDEESIRTAYQLGASEFLVKTRFTAPGMLEVVQRHARHDDVS